MFGPELWNCIAKCRVLEAGGRSSFLTADVAVVWLVLFSDSSFSFSYR